MKKLRRNIWENRRPGRVRQDGLPKWERLTLPWNLSGMGQGCRRKSYSGYPSLPLNYKNALNIEKTVL